MPYNKQIRTNFGGANTGTPPYGNFFGYGSLGDVTYSASTTLVNSASDSGIFESHYASLTVNSSVTLNLQNRSRAWIIYVQGDCTINGSITMSTGASAVASQAVNIRRHGVNGYNSTSTLVEASSGTNYTSASSSNGGRVSTCSTISSSGGTGIVSS
jgi:hypothetical protein